MNVIERVKNICLSPKTEWPVIAGETTPTGSLVTDYVAPLAAIGAVAGFVGGSVIGRTLPFIGTYRIPMVAGLGVAVFTFVMSIVGIFILSVIINALALSFSGEKNSAQALKVAVYSYTPAWVAGALQVLPMLGTLAVLGGLYGLYLLYLGLPVLMKSPKDKAIGYTAVVVICAIVLSIAITAVGGLFLGAGRIGAGVLSGATGGGGTSSEVQFDKGSALGKLQELGKKLEQSSQKMDAAEKSGDQSTQVAAALEGLGTLLGGGRRVDPVGIDQLKPFVPQTFAGLPRTGSNAERTGLAGVMVSKVQATYSDGAQKQVTLEVSDTGGVSGLLGLAGWVGFQGEKEDDSGSERTQKVDGRLTHERISKTGGTNEFAVVLGERFVVSARGAGVDINALKAGVSALDLGKLESMKDAGVQK